MKNTQNFVGQMSGVYSPGDIFRAIGRHWALDDDFLYPLDPGQHNSHGVLVKLNEEWVYHERQSHVLWEQATKINICVPKAQAIRMRLCDMNKIRNALYRIRVENNHILIRINREFFKK